ncbi:unnamed protein product [Effrenium voratum]|nr:unnamed protein product [Effrenium voratum]CAJ1419474.1 unnamed protein product [Effrenium voratum]|mmetsp:Transcript_51213/g.122695  ORF Transcript_51213/g.122695 Transcript_51213/m.122695 type:complete len:427 (-) Transcript_51213:48-1328(-)
MACGCCDVPAEVKQMEANVSQVVQDATIAVEAAVEKAEGAVEAVVEKAEDAIKTAASEFEAASESGLQTVKRFVEAKLRTTLKAILKNVPPAIKDATDDKDLPKFAKEVKDDGIDIMWHDIQVEIIREIEEGAFGEEEEPDAPGCCCCINFVRYHLYPYDRGLPGVFQDPFFLLCFFIALCPLFSIAPYMFLLIFLVIDKSDEFQLLFFILQVRGMQFPSDGMLAVYIRFVELFLCVQNGKDCLASTIIPSTWQEVHLYTDFIGYVLRLLLVWAAFLLLCRALRQRPPDDPFKDRIRRKGGNMIYLLVFDLVLSLGGIGAILGVVSQKDWDLVNLQLMSMINFVKFVHGFLSLPFFLLLVVPVLRNVVLHTWPTGYDRRGRCRRYIGPQKPTPKDSAKKFLPELEMDDVSELFENVKHSFLGSKSA